MTGPVKTRPRDPQPARSAPGSQAVGRQRPDAASAQAAAFDAQEATRAAASPLVALQRKADAAAAQAAPPPASGKPTPAMHRLAVLQKAADACPRVMSLAALQTQAHQTQARNRATGAADDVLQPVKVSPESDETGDEETSAIDTIDAKVANHTMRLAKQGFKKRKARNALYRTMHPSAGKRRLKKARALVPAVQWNLEQLATDYGAGYQSDIVLAERLGDAATATSLVGSALKLSGFGTAFGQAAKLGTVAASIGKALALRSARLTAGERPPSATGTGRIHEDMLAQQEGRVLAETAASAIPLPLSSTIAGVIYGAKNSERSDENNIGFVIGSVIKYSLHQLLEQQEAELATEEDTGSIAQDAPPQSDGQGETAAGTGPPPRASSRPNRTHRRIHPAPQPDPQSGARPPWRP